MGVLPRACAHAQTWERDSSTHREGIVQSVLHTSSVCFARLHSLKLDFRPTGYRVYHSDYAIYKRKISLVGVSLRRWLDSIFRLAAILSGLPDSENLAMQEADLCIPPPPFSPRPICHEAANAVCRPAIYIFWITSK